jgi:2C-methyl-D-erythritol 2,4-cyclodiphosphate synthase
LGQVLDVPAEAVSLKGKTNEGMGWIGAGEGLAVHAVALVERVND